MAQERQGRGGGLIPLGLHRRLDEMERHFGDIFGRSLLPFWYPFRPSPMSPSPEERGWTPTTDIFEQEDKFVVKAELPGLKEADIDVSVHGDRLTIKGEKKTESEIKEQEYHHSECSYGRFYRSITIPSTVDADKIKASYEDGVLEVILPKAPGVKSRKIAVMAKKKEER